MKTFYLCLSSLLLIAFPLQAQELHTFTNVDGKTREDTIVKYDYEERIITLEEGGKLPMDELSEADQAYVLKWNQVHGFMSSMRFKFDITRRDWADLEYEPPAIVPYFMDAIQLPGKKTPMHHIVLLEDYEESTSLVLEAQGYEISLRNANLFPIENLTVESKVYYEQEEYVIPEDLFKSANKDYTDTTTTTNSRFRTESIPSIAVRETVMLYSECAYLVDQEVTRSSIVTSDEGDSMVSDIWSDHSRDRDGKIRGLWLRVGIEGTDGNMVWREETEPASLAERMTWDTEPASEN